MGGGWPSASESSSARAGLVDGCREGALCAVPLAVRAVHRFEQRLYAIAEELRGVELHPLGRDGLAALPQVVGEVHDVVVAGPGAGAQAVVAGAGGGGASTHRPP